MLSQRISAGFRVCLGCFLFPLASTPPRGRRSASPPRFLWAVGSLGIALSCSAQISTNALTPGQELASFRFADENLTAELVAA